MKPVCAKSPPAPSTKLFLRPASGAPSVICRPAPQLVWVMSERSLKAWTRSTWAAYEAGIKKLSSTVGGVERLATPWPDWAITTVIDTRHVWPTVWRAVSCHASQIAAYEALKDLSPEHHECLWGRQSFYRAMSTVNGGRAPETDLFDGIDGRDPD